MTQEVPVPDRLTIMQAVVLVIEANQLPAPTAVRMQRTSGGAPLLVLQLADKSDARAWLTFFDEPGSETHGEVWSDRNFVWQGWHVMIRSYTDGEW